MTFFCGKEASEKEKSCLEEFCLGINSDIEVEIIDGEQEIYSYIIAVE